MTKKKELNIGEENSVMKEGMEHGIELFNSGKYIEAIDIFALLALKGNILARQYLARCYHRLEKYEIAYKHFEFLAKCTEGKTRDYGMSMLAAIEIVWGNYNKAIKILKSLPKTKNNLINLSILYWKKHKAEGDDYSIREAMRLLRSVKLDEGDMVFQKRIYHLMALIYQAEVQYSLAESYFNKALELAEDDVARGRILNDYGALLIECQKYSEAESMLKEAKLLVEGKSILQEAFCNKWLGILYKKQKKFEIAKKHLENALIGIKEKGLIQAIAEVNFMLAEISDKDSAISFYKAADFYADGVVHERLLEEVKCDDEKIHDFYYNSFFGDDSSGS